MGVDDIELLGNNEAQALIGDSEGREAVPFDLADLAESERLCSWIFQQFPIEGSKTVCDVGAGIGTFSQRILQGGAQELHLLEPDPNLFQYLQSCFCNDSRVTVKMEAAPNSTHLKELKGHFDFVLSQNVLEHIEDDFGALTQMADALAPGGKLGILVPANPKLFGSLDRAFGHHRRYTRDRLLEMSATAGLNVIDLRFFNQLGIPGWWFRNKLKRQSIGKVSLALYNIALRLWQPIEDRISVRSGLSLIMIAEKNKER